MSEYLEGDGDGINRDELADIGRLLTAAVYSGWEPEQVADLFDRVDDVAEEIVA